MLATLPQTGLTTPRIYDCAEFPNACWIWDERTHTFLQRGKRFENIKDVADFYANLRRFRLLKMANEARGLLKDRSLYVSVSQPAWRSGGREKGHRGRASRALSLLCDEWMKEGKQMPGPICSPSLLPWR